MSLYERERVVSILRELALPPGGFLVSGSAVMVLHGIVREKPMGDLDLFVATRTWLELQQQTHGHEQGAIHDTWKVWTTDPDDPARRCDPPYLYRTLHGLEVNVFSGWRVRGVGDIDVNLWMHNAELVQGWPCVPLRMLMDWKAALGRAKDLADIRLIAAHLEAVT